MKQTFAGHLGAVQETVLNNDFIILQVFVRTQKKRNFIPVKIGLSL